MRSTIIISLVMFSIFVKANAEFNEAQCSLDLISMTVDNLVEQQGVDEDLLMDYDAGKPTPRFQKLVDAYDKACSMLAEAINDGKDLGPNTEGGGSYTPAKPGDFDASQCEVDLDNLVFKAFLNDLKVPKELVAGGDLQTPVMSVIYPATQEICVDIANTVN